MKENENKTRNIELDSNSTFHDIITEIYESMLDVINTIKHSQTKGENDG